MVNEKIGLRKRLHSDLKLLAHLFPNQGCWIFALRSERCSSSSLLLRFLPQNAHRRNRRFWVAIFLFVFVGGNTYRQMVKTKLSLHHHGFEESINSSRRFSSYLIFFRGTRGHETQRIPLFRFHRHFLRHPKVSAVRSGRRFIKAVHDRQICCLPVDISSTLRLI